MNIILFGYGKMGKEIERLALERGMKVLAHVDTKTGIDNDALANADVIVHFATPTTVLRVANYAKDAKKNIVIGTTGWQQDLPTVRGIISQAGVGMVYAANFSLSVAIFNELVKRAGQLFNAHPQYDVAVSEIHHKEKTDAPSGTALSLAKSIMSVFRRKKEILAGNPSGKIKPEQLSVSSMRVGTITGTHSVLFDSQADSIELIHSAKNRTGFAYGALLAAEWLKGKQGIFTFEDVAADLIKLKGTE